MARQIDSQTYRQYEQFHGHKPDRVLPSLKLPSMRNLVCLGDVVEIVYRCKKKNGGGDGNLAEYQHKFSKGAKLYCTPDGNEVLLIHGHRIRVRSPGIIH